MLELLEQFNGKVAWLGGTDIEEEGNWRWLDGTKFSWTKWYSDEPNNSGGVEHCLHLAGDAWIKNVWNDAPCDRQMMSICKVMA